MDAMGTLKRYHKRRGAGDATGDGSRYSSAGDAERGAGDCIFGVIFCGSFCGSIRHVGYIDSGGHVRCACNWGKDIFR